MCLSLGQCQEFKNKYNTVRVKSLYIISRESDSRIANVRMSVFPSVCLSVRYQNPSASQICSYQPQSLLTIKPIDH